MSHSHTHGHQHGPDRSNSGRALTLALLLTAGFMVAEAIGGLLTDSLALLADAGHMLSDTLSLAIALVALRLARRPPTPQRSFGLQRAEILAALLNGLTLVVISLLIVWGAVSRLSDPPDVLGGPMLVVAFLGILVNLAAFRILSGSSEDSLNVSAALRHVLADLAGSVGAVVAAVLILTTGWNEADPVIAGMIGILIAASGIPILRDAVRVLLEEAPPGVDAGEIGTTMAAIPGVAEVHDLHVWSITSGFTALSAHVVVEEGRDCHERRFVVEQELRERFGIEHTTLQTDHLGGEALLQVEGTDSSR